MTKKQYKRLTQLIAAILALLIIAGLLSGCGVNTYIRKAAKAEEKRNKYIDKAITLGAKISRDTLWKTLEIPVPIIKKDTLFTLRTFRDTITINQDNIITRLKYDTVTRTMFLQSECIPDTIRIRVPIRIENEIKSPRGFWYYFRYIAIALIVGFVLGAVFGAASWAHLLRWIKSFL